MSARRMLTAHLTKHVFQKNVWIHAKTPSVEEMPSVKLSFMLPFVTVQLGSKAILRCHVLRWNVQHTRIVPTIKYVTIPLGHPTEGKSVFFFVRKVFVHLVQFVLQTTTRKGVLAIHLLKEMVLSFVLNVRIITLVLLFGSLLQPALKKLLFFSLSYCYWNSRMPHWQRLSITACMHIWILSKPMYCQQSL